MRSLARLALFVGLAFVGMEMVTPAPAVAQNAPTEEKDIAKALAPINGPDPVQRLLAARAALQSNSLVMRSLALEDVLESSDGRVREMGLIYLVDTQKQIIVTIAMTPSVISKSKYQTSTNVALANLSPLTMDIDNFDDKTLVFKGHFAFGSFVGSVSQIGLTASMTIGGEANCELQLRSVVEGALRGALVCGRLSFPASTPTP
jgi:hypothetical protein